MDIKRNDLFCKECLSPSTRGFKKVVTLKNSGLLIYLHSGEESKSCGVVKETKKNAADKSKNLNIFLLHNDSEHDLRRPDYAIELCQLRTRCFRCINIIKRVRSLLDELNFIRKNQVLGICEYCKRNPGACQRCQSIVQKFLDSKTEHLQKEKQVQFQLWLSKLNQLLHYVLNDESLDRGQKNSDPFALELERLLLELKRQLKLRTLHSTPADLANRISMTVGNDMIDELITKIKPEEEENKAISNTTSKSVTASLIEKDNASKIQSTDNLSSVTETYRKKAIQKDEAISEITSKGQKAKSIDKDNVSKTQSKQKSNVTESNSKKETLTGKNKTHSQMLKGAISKPPIKKLKGDGKKHSQKSTHTHKSPFPQESSLDIIKLITIYNQNPKTKRVPQNTANPYANVELPSLKTITADDKGNDKDGDKSDDDEDHLSIESFVNCVERSPDKPKIIKGKKLINCNPPLKKNLSIVPDSEKTNVLPDVNTVKQSQNEMHSMGDGVLRYHLSDKTFISKGYTILPVIKVMERVNLYKMEPVNPHFNWFERHKGVKTKNYDTGEILAIIEENGTGKWFYKNGRIALDYYNSEDVNMGQRYVLYSSGEERKQDQGARLKELKNKPQVLGVFDFQGNGAVYDLFGNERLKYNQTDGIIMDSKIGPLGRWKWHSLNEPPVLEAVLIDNYDVSISKSNFNYPEGDVGNRSKENQNPEVLEAELQIFAKQKVNKMLQKFKPFKIKTKAFKVNDEFSLRIIDQANIYLLFRHGTVSMKLNLGLHLVSTEIVGIEESGIGEVVTPYDRIPPKTSSIANIQYNLQNARNLQSKATSATTDLPGQRTESIRTSI